MPNYNKVMLMGNLTRDVELRNIPSGQAVANIGLAVNRRWRSKEGQEQEETTFVDCEAWGRTAEVMSQYLSKGRPVFIEGRLKLDQWEKEGVKQSKMRVVIERFEFIDAGGGGGGGGRDRSSAAPVAASTGGGAPHQPISEDDIPF